MQQKQEQNGQQMQERKQDMADALLEVFSSTDEAFDAFDTNCRGSITSFQWMRGLVDFRINVETLGIEPNRAFALIDAAQKGHVTRFAWRNFFEGRSMKPEALKPSLADVAISLPQGPKPLGGDAPRLRRSLSSRRWTVQGLDGEVSSEILSPQLIPSLSSALSTSRPKRPLPPVLPGARRPVPPKVQERRNPTNAQIAVLCKQVISNCGSLENAFQAFDVNGSGKITRVLFDSALAALQVNPESVVGLKPSRLFGLMNYNEGHINRATWDRFWEEYGVDLNMTVDVPEEHVVRRKAWKAAVKLTATAYSGILQRRNHGVARKKKEASEESLSAEADHLDGLHAKVEEDLPDGIDAKAEEFWHSQDLLSGPTGDIQLPPSPHGDDSLLMRRRMSLRRFLGTASELSAEGRSDSTKDLAVCKRDSCELGPLSPTYASTRSPSTTADGATDASDASDCDSPSMSSTPLPGESPGSRQRGKKPASDCVMTFVQDMLGDLVSLRRMGWLELSKTYGVDMTLEQMTSVMHELRLQGIPFEVTMEGVAMRIELKGDGPNFSIVSNPEMSEPKLTDIRDLGERKTHGADMSPEQMASLMRELELQGIPFEVTGRGAAMRLEVKGGGANVSIVPKAEGSEPSRRSLPSPRRSLSSSKQSLPSIGSPTLRHPGCTEKIDKENFDALNSSAFTRYASASELSEQKVLRKADLGVLVEKLRKSGSKDQCTNSGSDVKSNWVRKTRFHDIGFIKSMGCLERLFDEALELQIDMNGGSSAGLTMDFFKVYIQMCGAKLGWSSMSLLFTLLDDLDSFSTTF